MSLKRNILIRFMSSEAVTLLEGMAMGVESGGGGDAFSHISDEIKRQFQDELHNCESLDSKISAMLGFIFVSIGLIVTLAEPATDIASDKSAEYAGIIGVASLLVASGLGVIGFFIRKYEGGPEIDDLIKLYRAEEERDFQVIISRKLHDSYKFNHRQNAIKATLAKGMFVAFLVGLVLVVVWNLDRIWGG